LKKNVYLNLYSMKKIALLLCLAFSWLTLMGQTRITGTVTDADNGDSLPGVTVLVVGTSIGTVTDLNGKYSINVPEGGEQLEFSFVGLRTQRLDIGLSTVIDVVMEVDAVNMDEVLVIGYGTSTKEASTGAVSVIRDEEIGDVPETSFDKMLAGKVAGMMVTSTSGQPGAATEIRLRGTSSLNAGNEPLYVIDGIPVMEGDQSTFTMSGNALSSINPNDIESISVLKDAAAASIYGSRAANGVIIITTKSGKSGESKVNFRASYGVTSLANDNDYGVMTPEQLVEYMRTAVVNAGMDPDDPRNGDYYVPKSILAKPMNNWLKAATKYGRINNYELSVSGGSEKTSHYTSAQYSNTEGVFPNYNFTKYQLRSNIDHEISTRLRMGVKVNLMRSESNDMEMQGLSYSNPLFGGMLIRPWTPIFNENGTYNLNVPENGNTNPLANGAYDDQWEIQNRVYGMAYVEWEPIAGLKLKTNNGVEFTDTEGRRYWSPEAAYDGSAILQTDNKKYMQLTTSNTVSYTKYLNDHNISLLGGFEAIDNSNNEHFLWNPDVDPNIPFPNTGTTEDDDADYDESRYTMASFFGILDYSYGSRYYLRASLRTDGSSKFGENNRWGTFYSVGLSWNLHREAFLENVDLIDALKLRVSYGVNGNDRIGDYEQWGVYGPVSYNSTSGMAPAQPSNPDLTWEVNTSYNVGLDFGLFRRFNGTVEVYDRLTSSMLLEVPLSRTSGFTTLRQNIGELRNRGIEGSLNATILSGSVNWNAGLTIAHNNSEILNLGGQEQIIDGRMIHQVGENLYSFYLRDWAGVDPVSGNGLWYNDAGELTSLNSNARRVITGSPEPDLIGGFNTDLSWNGFHLNLNFEFKAGNEILIEELRYLMADGWSWNMNQVNTLLDYWKEPGDVALNPKPIAGNTTNSNSFANARWMFPGDFLRMKNVTLSYTIPEAVSAKMNLDRLRVYGSAVNAYTWHNAPFWDPERGVEGQGFGIYPMTKSFVVGLDLTF
jgi:TonB-linked SusC/RagA family outer membrane protein